MVEAQAFLRWAAADPFTFLGYREYAVKKKCWSPTKTLAGLGLMRGKDVTASRAR